MAFLHYKFASAKDYTSLPLDVPFISLSEFKQKIYESNYKAKKNAAHSRSNGGLCFGTDFDLSVINAETNEACTDDTVIARNSKFIVRRIPGGRCGLTPIDVTPIFVIRDDPKKKFVQKSMSSDSSASTVTSVSSSSDTGFKWSKENGFEFDYGYGDSLFGGDAFAVPKVKPIQPINNCKIEALSRKEEDGKIEALASNPALGLQGFGGMGSRGYMSGMKRKVPPEGYVCHRCNVAGHYIQHCPTNGDPNYDFRRVSAGIIAKSVPLANSNGSCALASGVVAAAATSLQRSHCVRDHVAPELLCPLCKQVMNDAAMSKCCFQSFCNKCISDQLISKANCFCGARALTEHLIPNLALRDTITRFVSESKSDAAAESKRAKTDMPFFHQHCGRQVLV